MLLSNFENHPVARLANLGEVSGQPVKAVYVTKYHKVKSFAITMCFEANRDKLGTYRMCERITRVFTSC